MSSFTQLNPTRIRSYILRLPLCTRLLLTVMVGLYIAAIPFPSLRETASLSPDKFDFTQSRSFLHPGRKMPVLGWVVVRMRRSTYIRDERLQKSLATGAIVSGGVRANWN